MVQAKNHCVQTEVSSFHKQTRPWLCHARQLLCTHASATMGSQGRPSKTPHQARPSSLSAKTPAAAGKPPAGRDPAAGCASKTPHTVPVSAARDAASKGQLTNKLEKSSSTPLVEVVTGDSTLHCHMTSPPGHVQLLCDDAY